VGGYFLEFVSLSDLKERYNKNIINYIKKTVVFQIDLAALKIGAIKNWTSHNIKTILNSIEDSQFRKNVRIIRKVGQVYTFSSFQLVYATLFFQNQFHSTPLQQEEKVL